MIIYDHLKHIYKHADPDALTQCCLLTVSKSKWFPT